MESSATRTPADIEPWLKAALSSENLATFSFEILEDSALGDGYVGDVIFVQVDGQAKDGIPKQYNLVVKCGKSSELLRAKFAVRKIYLNEIFVYKRLIPALKEFEVEKKVANIFDIVPMYIGDYVSDNVEVLVLENIKKRGYVMWKNDVLTKQHINLVLKEFGKWHASSLALQYLKPETYQEISDGLFNTYASFVKTSSVISFVQESIEEACDILADELDIESQAKISRFRDDVPAIFGNAVNPTGLKAFIHGDCWNNNFMYKNDDQGLPFEVMFLDWQLARVAHPIYDLSHLIYSAVSRSDLENFDDLLKAYYESFSNHLDSLGCKSEELYTYAQLESDWKIFGKHGLAIAPMFIKEFYADPNLHGDISETVESGKDIMECFRVKLVEPAKYRERLSYLFKHALEKGLLT